MEIIARVLVLFLCLENCATPKKTHEKIATFFLQRWLYFIVAHFFSFNFFSSFVSCTHTKLAITSTTDAYNKNATDVDSQQFSTSYQHQTSENLTAVEYAPLVASLVSDKQPDNENKLQENAVTALVSGNETASVTVIPVSNETQTIVSITMANTQTANKLQRNATVSWDQLNSRAVIKSSSPSAMANNNTTAQKQHKPDAPMLNYIFDSHLTNKHRHYDPRYVS